jgi:hypothetical protein
MHRRFVFAFCAFALASSTWASESWLGIYIQGSKVGYSGSVQKEEKFDGKPATKVWSINVFSTDMIGSAMDIRMETTSWVDAAGNLLRMDFKNVSQGRASTFVAIFKGKEIFIETVNTGSRGKKTLSIPEGQRVIDDPIARANEIVKGVKDTKATFLILDPLTISLVPNTVVFHGKATVKIWGSDFVGTKVEVSDPRTPTYAYLDEGGSIAKVEGPFGMEMYPETRAKAIDVKGGKTVRIDLAEISKVRVAAGSKNPGGSRKAVLKVSGPGAEKVVSDEQQLRQAEAGYSLVTVSPRRWESGVSLSQAKKDQPEFLKPSMLIPSDDSEMVSIAQRLAAGLDDTLTIADRITKHVSEMMSPNTGIGVLRDAREVLKTKEGLCRDHAVLCATLMRAAGVPTRVVSGLIFDGDAYYYHAWVECWSGTDWIGFDSTRGSEPFSAAHLKLGQGSVEEAFTFRLLNDVKVEILSVEK